jgi:hypothetical protein
MVSQVKSALLVTFLMLTSGCTGLLDYDMETQTPVIDCSVNSSHPDCFEKIIIEEDCNNKEIFMGDSCRPMLKPENLNYGENSILISIGEEMRPLTPSFIGDGPELWQVSPPLPEGLNLDENSGMIYGSSNISLTPPKIFIIKASNEAGFSNTMLQIEILPFELGKLEYTSDIINCIISLICYIPKPFINQIPDSWSIEPPLPDGLIISQNGSINGILTTQIDSNHTIYASNLVGITEAQIRIISLHSAPFGLNYEFNNYSLTKYNYVEIEPYISGGIIQSWAINPELPRGLRFNSDGIIEGKPMFVQEFTKYTITVSNSGGSLSTDILIKINDISVESIQYPNHYFNLTKNNNIDAIEPEWEGGVPLSWEIFPPLPDGLYFNEKSGNISGIALNEQNWQEYDIWANNTGGSISTRIMIKIINQIPGNISWPSEELILESNSSFIFSPTNIGPNIDTWEIYPRLPDGLSIASNGSIQGTPIFRTDWINYEIWSNNTGGSFVSYLWIVIHDIHADQAELLYGMGKTDWSGWPSPILPIGQWAFPIGFTEGGYAPKIPVISASHVGRGKMVGYGHESWVTGGESEETEFSLRAIEWACGKNSRIGLAYGTGFDHFKDELELEGHTVYLSAEPGNLSQLDCLLDEFWNGYNDQDNQNITDFLLSGGGLIMGGHAWYWSYSNSDLSNNYPGNKIAKTTGLFVSNAWGYNSIDFSDTPHELSRPHTATKAIREDRNDNYKLSDYDANIVKETLSICTTVVSLDFDEFWGPLRETVNETGWTVIEYGNLWQNVGYNLGEDPLADVLLRVEEALTQNLPANELPVHPSHAEFPGSVPSNASRISRSVTIDGNQSGLPSNFGYSQARAPLRMSTGLYAAPGEVVSIHLNETLVNRGIWILIGAHSDNLWGKDQLHRFPNIVRNWYVENSTMNVGNAFGGNIYVNIEAGSTLGIFDVVISNAIDSPSYFHQSTSISDWVINQRNAPAPWAEIGSELFILTVPSDEVRDLENPKELMDWWDQALSMQHSLYGYTPWPRIERAVFDVQISAGWMHSGYPFMAHDLSVPDVLDLEYMSENGDWGMFHELGHNHQWMPSTLPGNTETTCNFASVYLMEELVGISGHSAVDSEQRNQRMRNYFDDGSNISNWSVWTALDTHLIIKEKWGWEPFTSSLSVYYDLPDSEVPVGDMEEFNSWVMHLSNSTGYNLAPYHDAWGFPLTENTFSALSSLPVWVDDPLRGEYFVYESIIINLGTNNITSNSTEINWEIYDNGTNTSLTLYYGTSDAGPQTSSWPNSIEIGIPSVGHENYQLSDLSCCDTTYYARIKATNDIGSIWFGPINWTTQN